MNFAMQDLHEILERELVCGPSLDLLFFRISSCFFICDDRDMTNNIIITALVVIVIPNGHAGFYMFNDSYKNYWVFI